MIISHRHKFIYIANGKTASQSIERALGVYHDEPNLHCAVDGLFMAKHAPAAVIRELVGGARWSQYFTFGFVRHPVDRFLSVWRHYARDRELDVRQLVRRPRSTLVYWLRTRQLGIPPLPANVEEREVRRIMLHQGVVRLKLDCTTNLQYPVFYDSSDQLCVDFVGRYESLPSDLAFISKRIGIPIPSMPVVNVGKGRRDGMHFSPEAVELINETYREDFVRFGYSPATTVWPAVTSEEREGQGFAPPSRVE